MLNTGVSHIISFRQFDQLSKTFCICNNHNIIMYKIYKYIYYCTSITYRANKNILEHTSGHSWFAYHLHIKQKRSHVRVTGHYEGLLDCSTRWSSEVRHHQDYVTMVTTGAAIVFWNTINFHLRYITSRIVYNYMTFSENTIIPGMFI